MAKDRTTLVQAANKAAEIIERIESILDIGGTGTAFDSAKICDIRNLLQRYRKGEA